MPVRPIDRVIDGALVTIVRDLQLSSPQTFPSSDNSKNSSVSDIGGDDDDDNGITYKTSSRQVCLVLLTRSILTNSNVFSSVG